MNHFVLVAGLPNLFYIFIYSVGRIDPYLFLINVYLRFVLYNKPLLGIEYDKVGRRESLFMLGRANYQSLNIDFIFNYS